MRWVVSLITTLLCLTLLVACGGGASRGSGSIPQPPPVDNGGVPPAPVAISSRSAFFYTETFPRNSAYDRKHKLVFSTNQYLNQIEVFSTETRQELPPIPLSQPYALDLSPDNNLLWVGTMGEYLYAIDTEKRRIVKRVTPPRAHYYDPTQVRDLAVMANGSILLRMAGVMSSIDYLYQYFPSTGVFISRKGTINTPDYIGTVRRFSRSADGSKALVGQYDNLVLYDSVTDTFLQKAIAGASPIAALKPDGQQIVMRLGDGLAFFDTQLNRVGSVSIVSGLPPGTGVGRPIYSIDGRYVFVPENVVSRTIPRVLVVDTQTFKVVGNVADPYQAHDIPYCDVIDVCDWTDGGTTLQAVDETGLIIGATASGVSFIDTSSTAMLPSTAHGFDIVGSAAPAEGSPEGGTHVQLNGYGLEGVKIAFGKYWGTIAAADAKTPQVITPPSQTRGVVNVFAEFPDGWTTMAPYAFSYGPEISYIVPGGGGTNGGSTLTIWGYGFGTNKDAVSVQIGGRSATVQYVGQPGNGLGGAVSMYKILATIPPGVAGVQDLLVTTHSGTATARQGFRYLRDVQDYPAAGNFSQVLYDGRRQLIYMLDGDNGLIQVFSVVSRQFRSPITVGGSPTDMVLLSDSSKLAVSNWNDTVVLIDLDSPSNQVTVDVAIPSNTYDQHPFSIGASADGKVFVGYMTRGYYLGTLRTVDLQSSTVTTITDVCARDFCRIQSSRDGKRVFFAQSGVSSGNVSSYDAVTHTFTQERPMQDYLEQIAIAPDGNRSLFNDHFLDSENSIEGDVSVSPTVVSSTPNGVYGRRFHDSGGLLYLPLTNGLHIYDAQHGRLLRSYEGMKPTTSSRNTIALDETGQMIFSITTSGLEIVTLDSVPLSIGHVDPSNIAVSAPSAITIRGSGFGSQTRVAVNDTEIIPVLVDANTLQVITPALSAGPVSIAVYGPDGERFELGNAIRVQ